MPNIADYTAMCACAKMYYNGRSIDYVVSEYINLCPQKLVVMYTDDEHKPIRSSLYGMPHPYCCIQRFTWHPLLLGQDDYSNALSLAHHPIL